MRQLFLERCLAATTANLEATFDGYESAAATDGSTESIRAWWLRRMIETPYPLLEKMTLFWHHHFAISNDGVNNARLMVRSIHTLRQGALGSYRQLLGDVINDPALYLSLRSDRSRRSEPATNVADQLLSRFGVGPGHYNEHDLNPAARALTGRFVLRNELRFFAHEFERSVVPHVRSLNQWPLASAELPAESGEAPSAEEPLLLQHLRRTAVAAHGSRRQIEQALRSIGDRRLYPNSPLGGQLKIISNLIRADVGVRIFFTELGGGGIGGFDNHANQRDNHAALLRQLSEAVTAFVDDLDDAGLADRVVLMTFSEFGRTLQENGRRGTDHGNAAPIFLAGGRLQGGLHGTHPDLTDLEGDSPKPHTDFRQLYATVLDQWLGFDSHRILHDNFSTLNLFA